MGAASQRTAACNNVLDISRFPSSPGTYALWVPLTTPAQIAIGRLGEYNFIAGVYIYVGSALGEGGLRARLSRHLKHGKTPHWHIDWLLAIASVTDVFYFVSPTHLECKWAQTLASLPTAALPVRSFGSSDCRKGCEAHLIRFPVDTPQPEVWESLSLVSAKILAAENQGNQRGNEQHCIE